MAPIILIPVRAGLTDLSALSYQIRLNNLLFSFSLLFLLPSALSPPKKGVVNPDLVSPVVW